MRLSAARAFYLWATDAGFPTTCRSMDERYYGASGTCVYGCIVYDGYTLHLVASIEEKERERERERERGREREGGGEWAL